MTIIAMPARFGWSDLPTFQLSRASNEVRGKYTPFRQLLPYPYAIWVIEGTLVELDGRDAALMRSFLAQLQGKKNKFRLPIPGYFRSSTGYNADGVLDVPLLAQDRSLTASGVTSNTPIIAEGEYITVNDECKIVTASAASGNNNRVQISFEPPMRKPALAGVAVKFVNPTVLVNADDDNVASWSIKVPIRQSSKLRLIEAVEK